MPGPEQVVRAFVTLPFTVARRVAELLGGLLPGGEGDTETPDRAPRPDPEAPSAANEALARERDPAEEAIFTPDDDFFDEEEHVEPQVELVAESADPEAVDPPGPQLHVDEPWDGYRRMKVAEIATRLEGQSPEVLAAVELYETTHRNRQGVLEAVRAANRG